MLNDAGSFLDQNIKMYK